MKQGFETHDAALQQQSLPSHVPDRPRKWQLVSELRDELRFPSDKACRMWLKREGIACVKRGRVILVSPIDVAKALRRV